MWMSCERNVSSFINFNLGIVFVLKTSSSLIKSCEGVEDGKKQRMVEF
jgi:hypothetical protein